MTVSERKAAEDHETLAHLLTEAIGMIDLAVSYAGDNVDHLGRALPSALAGAGTLVEIVRDALDAELEGKAS